MDVGAYLLKYGKVENSREIGDDPMYCWYVVDMLPTLRQG